MRTEVDTMIVRISEYEAIRLIEDEKTRGEALLKLLEQGFTLEQQYSDSPMVNMLLLMAYPNQLSSAERYLDSKENGAKGGRPGIDAREVERLYADGLTKRAIAERLGCNVKTVSNKLRETGKNQKNTGKNLNTDKDTDTNTDKNKDVNINTNTSVDSGTDVESDRELDSLCGLPDDEGELPF